MHDVCPFLRDDFSFIFLEREEMLVHFSDPVAVTWLIVSLLLAYGLLPRDPTNPREWFGTLLFLLMWCTRIQYTVYCDIWLGFYLWIPGYWFPAVACVGNITQNYCGKENIHAVSALHEPFLFC